MRNQHEETNIDGALQRSVGECGYGQIRIYALVNMVWAVTALQVYMMNFAEVDSVLEKDWQCTSNEHDKCKKLFAHGNDDHGLKEGFCKMHRKEWEWIDRDSSIVSEFNLECDDNKLRIVRQLFFLGQFLGSGMLGYTADKTGRQTALLLSSVLSGLSTLLTAFAPSYWVYTLLRFLTGFGAGGQVVSAFVLWTEFVGPSKRGKLGIAAPMIFSVGQCLLVALAYLLGTWRTISFACGVLSVTFFLILMWMPESPRWLLIRGRKGEAAGVLAAIASANRTKLPEVPLAEMAAVGNTDRMLGEVLKHKRLREWLLIILATWFSLFTVNSGISVLIDTLPEEDYIKFTVMAVIEILAYVVYLALVDRVGRQPLFVWGLVIGGACCICSCFVPQGLLLMVIIAGKFATSGALAVAFLYTTEMFPTSVRGASLGAAGLSGKGGGLFASCIAYFAKVLVPAVPLIVFGIFGLAAGALALGLPETIGVPLPDTAESISTAPGPRRRCLCWGRRRQPTNYSKLDEDTIT